MFSRAEQIVYSCIVVQWLQAWVFAVHIMNIKPVEQY